MAAPALIAKPLRGMGTGLGRLVLGLIRLGALASATFALLLVLDALLLPNIHGRPEREPGLPTGATRGPGRP